MVYKNFDIFFKFKLINHYFLTKFLNSSIKKGKRFKFYNLYFKFYHSFFLNNFYFYQNKKSKTIGYYSKIQKPFFLKFKKNTIRPDSSFSNLFAFYYNQNKFFVKINYLIMNFFKHNTFILSFFVEKHKTFINHKKKFLDKVVFVYVGEKNKNFIFFKFFKVLFLRKNYKKTFLNMINYNLLEYSNSVYRNIFEKLIYEVNSTRKKTLI